jgi:hypothetical protein
MHNVIHELIQLQETTPAKFVQTFVNFFVPQLFFQRLPSWRKKEAKGAAPGRRHKASSEIREIRKQRRQD